MARGDPQLNVRLPDEALRFLTAQAMKNGSSKTSEVLRCIRERMDRETKTATSELAGSN